MSTTLTYKYKARNKAGHLIIGNTTAANVGALREQLRRKQLFVTEYQEEATISSTAGQGLFRRRKCKLDDMVVMSRQLATLVKAGLPIVESLDSVIDQTNNVVLKEALTNTRADVLAGKSLTGAMKGQPHVFSELYTSLVEAGEMGSLLEHTLETAAVLFDKEAELRAKVKSAFVYPVLVIFASIAMVAFMLVFIVPVFADVYKQFHCQLPLVTQMLVTISFILLHYAWLVALGIFGFVVAFKQYIKTKKGRARFDAFKLKMPLLGKLIHKMCIARFTRTFGGLMKAGVPVLSALETAANTAANVTVIEAVKRVQSYVKEGT